MNFELPTTGTEQSPAFVTAETCQEWLAKVPIANAVQAQAIFLQQLLLLHRFTLAPTERFNILETLRHSICAIQEDASKKFAGKPLPFAPHEQAALDSTLNVWHALALGYLRCFDGLCGGNTGVVSASALAAQQAQIAGHPELAGMAAKLIQRTLSVFADWQVDLCRGEQLPDALYWRKLNEIFSAAEVLGVATRTVSDHQRHGPANTSALATYAECHLISTANVFELPARHLGWVVRWARRWGLKISLLKAPPEDIRNRAVPLWVDIESDRPASYEPQESSGSRWLETTELRKSLIARITLLARGREPAELQLGDDVTQPAATQLLQRVLQRWCRGGASRHNERRVVNADCNFIAGFEMVHFQLSGRHAFRSPTRSDTALRREREVLETFGEHSREGRATDDGKDAHVEKWHVVDESAGGLRVTRPLKEGVRISAGMVVAVRIADSQAYTLGNVRWALREGESALVAGIQLFAGDARPVAVRVVEQGSSGQFWQQGFLLPEMAAANEPASVILPAGTYRIERRIEIMVDQKPRQFKLCRVLDRGIEFERCNFYD
jgi:hypothetical protein